jgi:septum formation protein
MLRLNSPIILASQSPRRKQLLEWAEVAFEVIVAGTDESYPKELVVEHVPVYIAQQKADAVLQKLAIAKREGLTQ